MIFEKFSETASKPLVFSKKRKLKLVSCEFSTKSPDKIRYWRRFLASTYPLFALPELCGILYLLYTHKLNPVFFRGLMLLYALSQQLSHLVLLQTLHYLFFAVQHVHHTQPDHASHFLVWAKVNIASFQRFAISSLAFTAPDVTVFLNHVAHVYVEIRIARTYDFLLKLIKQLYRTTCIESITN